MSQAPTSQVRPRDTDHLRPSNLAARTVSLVERTLSKFGGDPCPVRPGLAAAVKCYVRKKRFPCVGSEQNDPALPTALLTCFGVMKGNTVLFSVFWNDDCWPKKRPCQFLFHDSQNPWCKVSKPKRFACRWSQLVLPDSPLMRHYGRGSVYDTNRSNPKPKPIRHHQPLAGISTFVSYTVCFNHSVQ